MSLLFIIIIIIIIIILFIYFLEFAIFVGGLLFFVAVVFCFMAGFFSCFRYSLIGVPEIICLINIIVK